MGGIPGQRLSYGLPFTELRAQCAGLPDTAKKYQADSASIFFVRIGL